MPIFATSGAESERREFVSVVSIAASSETLDITASVSAGKQARTIPRWLPRSSSFQKTQFAGTPTNTVSLWLYQIDINYHRLNQPSSPPPVSLGGTGLSVYNVHGLYRHLDGLKLHYLMMMG